MIVLSLFLKFTILKVFYKTKIFSNCIRIYLKTFQEKNPINDITSISNSYFYTWSDNHNLICTASLNISAVVSLLLVVVHVTRNALQVKIMFQSAVIANKGGGGGVGIANLRNIELAILRIWNLATSFRLSFPSMFLYYSRDSNMPSLSP